MAGTIPTSMPPAFGGAYADRQQAAMSNQASMLGSQLDAQSSNLGHILGNIRSIAEVSGGALTPNMLARMFAGAQQDPFNQDGYAQTADNLRLAQSAADLAATNRSGQSGGSRPDQPDDGQWYEITFPDGRTEQRLIPNNEVDSVPYHQRMDGVTVTMIPTPAGRESSNVIPGSGASRVQQTADRINRENPGTNAEVRNGVLYVDGVEFSL